MFYIAFLKSWEEKLGVLRSEESQVHVAEQGVLGFGCHGLCRIFFFVFYKPLKNVKTSLTSGAHKTGPIVC